MKQSKLLFTSFLVTACLCTTTAHADTTDVTIEDFGFLAGFWQGEGFGGQSEEMWMPPSNGRMFGVFTQTNDNALVFSEYMEISQQEGGWVLRLKHFNPDFSGWEEKPTT